MASSNKTYLTYSQKYDKIMELYNNVKVQYESDIISEDNDKRFYANQYLRSDIENYEAELLNIYNEILALLKVNDEAIIKIRNKTDELIKQNEAILDNIDKLKSTGSNATGYADNNIELTKSVAKYHKYNIVYKIVCFVLLVLLCGIIYVAII